jgi:hypothetical protein
LRPSPVAYSAASYTAEREVVNPGETLYYTPTLTIRQGGYVRFVRSFWDIGRNQVALDCEGNTTASIVVDRSIPPIVAGVVRGNIVRLKIPMMPPGDYELVSTAIGPNGGQAYYTVRFRVDTPCG